MQKERFEGKKEICAAKYASPRDTEDHTDLIPLHTLYILH